MKIISYYKPKRVWADEDAVYAEAYDGTIVVMTAEVAIYVSRMFGAAGGDALLNRIRQNEAAKGK